MHVPFVLSLLALILTMLEFGTVVNLIRAKVPTMGGMSSKFWQLWSRPSIRTLFHWKNSNGLIFFLWGAVIAMAALGATLDNADYLFKYAYVFAVAGFLFLLGSWLTSKTVGKERRSTRQQRRHGNSSGFKLKTYAGYTGITTLLIVSCYGISEVRLHRELQSLANNLYPSSERTPGNGCNEPPAEGAMEGNKLFLFGDDGNGALVKTFPHTVVSMMSDKMIPECTKEKTKEKGCSVLSVGKNSEDESMYVVMDVRDKHNNVIVQLDQDGFHINPNNYFRMLRKDRSSLVVKDQEDTTVLDIAYLNPKTISVDGVLYVHGQRVPLFLQGISNSCSVDTGISDFQLEVP
jgi:hypothetical protein